MKARSPSKFTATLTPVTGPVTYRHAVMSTPARRQCCSATREPRSSPSSADMPARTPRRLAAVAAVTAPPPMEKAN